MDEMKNLTDEEKAYIDNASTQELLRKWRFAPLGSDYFYGERGEYFKTVLFARQRADPAAWTAASKAIGW